MKKNTKYMFLILAILGFALLATYGFSLAKYASNSIWNYYLESKGFYFSSDDLSQNSVKNINNNWDGGSVYFNIKNSVNDSLITSYDIRYKVECTVVGDMKDHAECLVNGSDSSTYEAILSGSNGCVNYTDDGVSVSVFAKDECEISGYDWKTIGAIKDLYFDLESVDGTELNNVSVSIKVTSLSPYSKSLSGSFILHKGDSAEDLEIKYNDYTDYGMLIASNDSSEGKCIKLAWNPSDLRIDINPNSVNSYELTDGYISSITINLPASSSYNYLFYKQNLETISADKFKITKLDNC